MVEKLEPSVAPVAPTTSVPALLKKAKGLAEQKNLDEALVCVEAAIRIDPSSRSAHSAAGRIKFRQKRYDDASKHFDEVIRLDPMKPKIYLWSARAAYGKKDYVQALAQIQNAIKLNSKLASAYVGAGQVCIRTNQLAEGEKYLLQAIQLNPRLVVARQRLALIYTRTERVPASIEQLQYALRVAPDNADSYEGLGANYLARKEYEPAREAFSQAVKFTKPDQSATRARTGLAEACIALSMLLEAEETLRQIPEREQGTARCNKLWGDLYSRKGMHKEALDAYKAAELLAREEGVDMDKAAPAELALPGEDDAEAWNELIEDARGKAEHALDDRRQKIREARGAKA